MADANGSTTRRQRGPAFFLIFGLILLASLPAYAKFLGYPFVPSVEWMAGADHIERAGGLIFAGAFVWSTWVRQRGKRGGRFGDAIGIVISTLAGYLIGSHAVVTACPMILALVAGHPVQLAFTLADADPQHPSRCGSAIELRDVPPIFNGLCGASRDLGKGLRPGGRILVSGRGTGWGLFVERVRPGD